MPPEVTTEYAGTTLGAYYTDAEVKLRTQLAAKRIFQELYGVDVVSIGVDTHSYLGVAALGGEVVIPEDDPPMIRHLLDSAERAFEVTITPPEECEAFQRQVWIYHYYQRELGNDAQIHMSSGQEGPVTTAVLLRGEGFYTDLYTHPKAAHALLEKAVETYIIYANAVSEITGQEGDGVGICDDFAGLISPKMFKEFVIPYWRRIYEELGSGPRTLHCELLRPAHLGFLDELEIASYDPGTDQYLRNIKVLRDKLDDRFWWNLIAFRDLKEGTPDSIRRMYTEAVAAGAPAIMTELCRGIPPENVRAFVEVARSFE